MRSKTGYLKMKRGEWKRHGKLWATGRWLHKYWLTRTCRRGGKRD